MSRFTAARRPREPDRLAEPQIELIHAVAVHVARQEHVDGGVRRRRGQRPPERGLDFRVGELTVRAQHRPRRALDRRGHVHVDPRNEIGPEQLDLRQERRLDVAAALARARPRRRHAEDRALIVAR